MFEPDVQYLVSNGLVDDIKLEDLDWVDGVGNNLIYYARDINTFDWLVNHGVDKNKLNIYSSNMLSISPKGRDFILHALNSGMVLSDSLREKMCIEYAQVDEVLIFSMVYDSTKISNKINKELYRIIVKKDRYYLLKIVLEKDVDVRKNINSIKYLKTLIKKGRGYLLSLIYTHKEFNNDHDLIEIALKYYSTIIIYFLVCNNSKSKYTDRALEYLQNWDIEMYKEALVAVFGDVEE